MLTAYDWIYGSSQIAAAFLAVAALLIAITLLHRWKKKENGAWIYVSLAIFLFSITSVLGSLSAFGFYNQPLLSQTLPGVTMGAIIAALVIQLQVNKGCGK